MRAEAFVTGPKIEIRKLDEATCEFYLTGTDVSIANALRRVILAEVRRCGSRNAGSLCTKLTVLSIFNRYQRLP